MGTSRRHFWTGRAALLLGGLAFACSDKDFSIVDPTALDIDPPGWGGASGRLDSNVDAGNAAGAEGNTAGAAGEGSGGAAGEGSGGAAGEGSGGAAGEGGAGGEGGEAGAAGEGGEGGTAGEGGEGGTAGEGGEGGTAGDGGEGGTAGDGGAAGSAEQPDGGTPPDPPECEVAFVTPSADEVPLILGPGDDQDGAACGATFGTNVVVSSNAASVTLFVDGTPVDTQFPSSETASFEGVLLGTRIPASSTLRAVATMADTSTCETTISGLGVDCEGPTCTLTGPNTDPWLTSEDDLDPITGGVQANFTLTTDAGNGTDARLFLDGDTNNPLLSTVLTDTATFASVTLAEGLGRTVQGECRDDLGNVTLSGVATWSVTLAECQVAITTPAPGSGALTLGPNDDQDGAACGTNFTTSVEVSTNAESVALLVDGQPVDSALVTGPGVQFTNVVLGTRTPASSTITVNATMPDGRTCSASRSDVVVDCEGPTCTLVATSNNPFFNLDNDEDDQASGLQTTFRVETSGDNVDQPVRLIVDDDEGLALSDTFDANGPDARATFSPVTLDEGPLRTVQAECEDPFGNVTRSSLLSWAVDLTPCTIQIDSVANDVALITRAIDESSSADIQVSVEGSISGQSCGGVRVGVCGQPLGTFDTLAVDINGNWTLPVTLADVSGSGEVCAEVIDAAENVVEDRVPVEVRSNDPIVEVASPLNGDDINLLGTAGAIADLDNNTAACDAQVVVHCTDVGAAVVLSVDGTPLPGTVLCVADVSAVAPYQGTATFPLVTFDPGSDTHTLVAEQTVAGLVGTSPTVTVNTDCVAPVVAITDPICNGQLHLIDDDTSVDSGLQYTVSVANGGVPSVTLTVVRTAGSADVSNTGNATTTTFADVNFGDPGDVALTAKATDPAGNVGTATCDVTVVVEPTVTIVAPTAAQVLAIADDCDPDGGYGITVSGTTNAPAGSSVEVTAGALAAVPLGTVVAGSPNNTFSGCVPANDGANQLITVEVDDGINPPGSNTVTVTVDTAAPPTPVPAPLVSVTNRRAGQVTFTWDHVVDADGSTLAGYEMRCAATAIGNEAAWDAARQLTVNTVGALATAPDASELIPSPTCTGNFCRSFRVGTTEQCVIRGRDAVGLLTPLTDTSTNVAVSIPFTQTNFASVLNGNSSVTNVVGVGDVNGDGAKDMVYGVLNQGLQLFFGGSSFDTTADVAFTNGGVSAFGGVLAPLGDINGDSIPDFAASARLVNTTDTSTVPSTGGASGGMVYIFFGKAGAWPSSTVTVNPGTPGTVIGCGADVCLRGSASGAFFGWDIAATDFDGDGTNDIVVAARAANSLVGTVYVLRGGAQFQVAAGTSIRVPADGPNGWVLNPPASRSNFGNSIADLGPGSDGRGDLAIAANGAGTANLGSLFFMAGESYPPATSGLVAPSASSPQLLVEGSTGDFPSPVRGAGDFDGDGVGDLLLGRNSSAGGGLGTAQLYVRRDPLPFGTGVGFVFDFAATGTPDTDFGAAMANGLHPLSSLGGVGDLDGDGLAELAVGSLAGSTGGSMALFYGTISPANRLRTAADFTLSSSATSIMTPNYIGDFDGDGFHDLAVVDGGSGTDRIILLH